MCTYNFSLSDTAVNRIRPAFKDEAALREWMLKQLETAIMCFKLPNENKANELNISDEVAWFSRNPVVLTKEDRDERTEYILSR